MLSEGAETRAIVAATSASTAEPRRRRRDLGCRPGLRGLHDKGDTKR